MDRSTVLTIASGGKHAELVIFLPRTYLIFKIGTIHVGVRVSPVVIILQCFDPSLDAVFESTSVFSEFHVELAQDWG
jgi:hypothetical protein